MKRDRLFLSAFAFFNILSGPMAHAANCLHDLIGDGAGTQSHAINMRIDGVDEDLVLLITDRVHIVAQLGRSLDPAETRVFRKDGTEFDYLNYKLIGKSVQLSDGRQLKIRRWGDGRADQYLIWYEDKAVLAERIKTKSFEFSIRNTEGSELFNLIDKIDLPEFLATNFAWSEEKLVRSHAVGMRIDGVDEDLVLLITDRVHKVAQLGRSLDPAETRVFRKDGTEFDYLNYELIGKSVQLSDGRQLKIRGDGRADQDLIWYEDKAVLDERIKTKSFEFSTRNTEGSELFNLIDKIDLPEFLATNFAWSEEKLVRSHAVGMRIDGVDEDLVLLITDRVHQVAQLGRSLDPAETRVFRKDGKKFDYLNYELIGKSAQLSDGRKLLIRRWGDSRADQYLIWSE